METSRRTLTEPWVNNNPVTLQILGICSALAVTTSLSTALVMSAALTVVLSVSNVSISLIRRHIPRSIRLILQITIIASFVMVVDQFIQAFAWDMSKRLSVFVSLIVTNCIVLGRAEAFASTHGPYRSFLDGLGNGMGYAIVLITIGTLRELFGRGTLLGEIVFTQDAGITAAPPLSFMLLAPAAFFLLGLMVWLIRSARPEQCEENEFPLLVPPRGK